MQDKALAMCDQHIVLVFVVAKKSGRLPGEIWYHSIKAGKEVAEETTINPKYNPNTAYSGESGSVHPFRLNQNNLRRYWK